MTTRAIPLLALVTALSLGCNGRSSQGEPAMAASAATQEHSSGAERGLPPVERYADQLDDPSRNAWQKPEEVVELLDCRPGATVVDLGVGSGYFISYLSEAVGSKGRVLALDLKPSVAEYVRKRSERQGLRNVEPITVAPDDPGLSGGSVDRVLVVSTWHHISDRVQYAKKLLGALRPGGALLIVDFTMESPIGPPPEKRLTVDTVVAELESAGFVVEVLEETLPHQYAIAGRAP